MQLQLVLLIFLLVSCSEQCDRVYYFENKKGDRYKVCETIGSSEDYIRQVYFNKAYQGSYTYQYDRRQVIVLSELNEPLVIPLEKNNDTIKSKLKVFPYDSRYYEFVDSLEIFVRDSSYVVYRIVGYDIESGSDHSLKVHYILKHFGTVLYQDFFLDEVYHLASAEFMIEPERLSTLINTIESEDSFFYSISQEEIIRKRFQPPQN